MQQAANGQIANGDGEQETVDAMAALERQARAPVGFVAASTGPEGASKKPAEELPSPAAENPDSINLDDDL
jgi:pre-mRNA-splicing factor SYF1